MSKELESIIGNGERVALITKTELAEHWHDATIFAQRIYFSLNGIDFMTSSVMNRVLKLDETMLFQVMGGGVDWSGMDIGVARLDIPEWLEDHGITVSFDIGELAL